MNRLLVVVCLATACAPPAPDSQTDFALNQFRQAQQDLTLPDGGQCAVTINAAAELTIRDLAVVEDPLRTNWTGGTTNLSDGAWSFGRLMTAMAGPNDPAVFVRNWLAQWDTPQTINGFVVGSRTMNAAVTAPWLAASGGTRLDLTRAPFRLLAIVNRMDLRNLAAGSAGEGRFVFGVLDPAGNPLQFTVILEYRLPATTNADVKQWADQWHALAGFPIGSAQYNQALETITNRFAGPNVAPTRPNGSSINQVRSNEIALSAPWELREFHLDATRGGALVEAPVAQTTDLTLNNSPNLAAFVNQNTAALLNGTDVVPATFNGAPFLGGSALTNPGQFWNAPGISNNEARFQFSVNTCNGCHAGETGTVFLHVAPRARGSVSVLSTFLTGKTQPDPVSGAPRTFNDLDFRATSLGTVLCASTTPATVRITAPTAGTIVRGFTTVTATASAGVTAVQFFVDGNPLSPPLPSPFSAPWPSDSIPFGPHTLTAVATAPTGNVTSAPVAITTAPVNGPDFTVTAFTAPSSAITGAPVSTQVTVCNKGNQPGSTPIDLVLSPDSTINVTGPTPDRLVGNAFSGTLAPGQCSTLTAQGNASPPGLEGAYFFAAVADVFNGVAELDESNNISPKPLIGIGFAPDFVVTAVTGPASALLGAPFTAQVTVCNRGTTPASTPVDVLLSTDSTIVVPVPPTLPLPTDDTRIGFAFTPTLLPGQCVTQAVPVNAQPPGFTQGAYFLGAIADVNATVRELIETNNSKAGTKMGIGSAPDFVVSSISAAASVLPGSSFPATVTVCNNGTVSGTTQVDLVLSVDSTIAPPVGAPGPTDDRLIGGGSVTLAAGTCSSLAINAFANPPGAPGSYFLGAIVDFPKVVSELIETNNTASRAIAVGSGPDFVVTSVTGPTSALPGAPFTATAVVCNQGTVAGSTLLELVLSIDATITIDALPTPTSDLRVGGVQVSLAAGQCLRQPVTGNANGPVGNGTYTLGAVVDSTNAVLELNETNNVTPKGPLFSIGFSPDFVITAVTLVQAPTTMGSPLQAQVTVCNRGTIAGQTDLDLASSIDSVIAPVFSPGPNDDKLITAAPVTVMLQPGQCLAQLVSGFANPPTNTPGTYFLGAVADFNNRTPELVETNNASAGVSFKVQ